GGHLRGSSVGIVVGLVVSLIFFVFKLGYVFDIALDTAFDPRGLSRAFQDIANDPRVRWWTWLFWLPEWGFGGLWLAFLIREVAIEPYCTRCRTWTTDTRRVYGPLQGDDAITELLFGRYWHLFALARVPADRSVATLVRIDHCARDCSATTLITLTKRMSSRAGEALTATQESTLVRHLYVPRRLAEDVRQWATATSSIRPNLVTDTKSPLYRVVAALLPLLDELQGNIHVYGDIPNEVLMKARAKAGVPDNQRVAAIAVEDYWFVVRVYSVYVLTDWGVHAYNTKQLYTPYTELKSML